MAYDFAIDSKTGDWLFTGSRDIQGVAGDQVVQQRIITRLKIIRGSWPLDPTNGLLGSRLSDALHLPRQRAFNEIQLWVEEALSPMRDVSLIEVFADEVAADSRAMKVTIKYQILNVDNIDLGDLQAAESVTFELA